MSFGVKIQIYGTIILLVVLYGCAACSLILREHRLRCQARMVLRNVFSLGGGSNNKLEEFLH